MKQQVPPKVISLPKDILLQEEIFTTIRISKVANLHVLTQMSVEKLAGKVRR
jgi:hypothetical protein